jgi:hypothetical protein
MPRTMSAPCCRRPSSLTPRSQDNKRGKSETPPQSECPQRHGRRPPLTNPLFADQCESVAVETAHPHHRSISPNDANKGPCTHVSEQGPAPLSYMWHGCWGIGHTPIHECAHIPVTVFPSLIPCMQKPRGTSLMPCTRMWHGLWGIGQTLKTQRRHDLPTTTTNAQKTTTPPHVTQQHDHHTTQTTYNDATTPPCDITTQRRDCNGTRHNNMTTTRQHNTNRMT